MATTPQLLKIAKVSDFHSFQRIFPQFWHLRGFGTSLAQVWRKWISATFSNFRQLSATMGFFFKAIADLFNAKHVVNHIGSQRVICGARGQPTLVLSNMLIVDMLCDVMCDIHFTIHSEIAQKSTATCLNVLC